MKIRRPAYSNTVRNTNAQKHEGMEMPQGYFPQKGRTLGLTVCHCGHYQTVHWTILEAFATVTVNTKMRNLQDLLRCYCMLTRLHDGSDRRQLSSLFVTFSVKVSCYCIAYYQHHPGTRHIATRTIRYTDTDRQTDRQTWHTLY
jgi:ferredoxin-thioredoxin reductase catalytic subunit